MRVLVKIVVNGIGVYVCAQVARPALEFVGSGPALAWTIGWVGLLFGLLNTFALPVLRRVNRNVPWPLVALITFTANALVLLLISKGTEQFEARLRLENFWPVLIGGLIATTVSLLLHVVLPARNHSLVKEMA